MFIDSSDLILALGILAGMVQLIGYWQYNKAMAKSGHKPNVASWFMWGLGGATELIVYSALVRDQAKEILPLVCAAAAVIIFIRVWWKERTLHLDRGDWFIVIADVAVVTFWFVTKNPFASNVLLGMDMLLSFYPIILSTWKDPSSENPVPWRTWTFAYLLLTLVVILDWKSGWELIYPVLYLVLHATIWKISRVKMI